MALELERTKTLVSREMWIWQALDYYVYLIWYNLLETPLSSFSSFPRDWDYHCYSRALLLYSPGTNVPLFPATGMV